MGAGATKEQIYRGIYEGLHKVRRTLAENGVSSIYCRRMLSGEVSDKAFNFTYRIARASNGECCGWLVTVITDLLTGELETFGVTPGCDVWADKKRGIVRVIELFSTIVKHETKTETKTEEVL